jgi:hypothetical protein
MNTELISNLANLALALSFITALIFGIVQVQIARRDRRERLTLEVLNRYQTREFAELMNYINTHNLPTDRQSFWALPVDEQVSMIQFGQQMESLGIMLAGRFISISLVDKTLGSFITTSWEKCKPLFTDIRVNQPDPYLGEYFQWLAENIDKRMKENPRVPFNEVKRHSTGLKH